jgi:hypothetical protein
MRILAVLHGVGRRRNNGLSQGDDAALVGLRRIGKVGQQVDLTERDVTYRNRWQQVQQQQHDYNSSHPQKCFLRKVSHLIFFATREGLAFSLSGCKITKLFRAIDKKTNEYLYVSRILCTFARNNP